jgi:excisionase family DNA binding protein
MKLISTAQAAERLGVSTRRVVFLIHAGRLKAKKIGRDWIINPKDLELIWKDRPRESGRPTA